MGGDQASEDDDARWRRRGPSPTRTVAIIPEESQVTFDGACRYATNITEQFPCARCKRISHSHFYCELLVSTQQFYNP
eukprot:3884322-Lingulodinium_polyedra.AAC.1